MPFARSAHLLRRAGATSAAAAAGTAVLALAAGALTAPAQATPVPFQDAQVVSNNAFLANGYAEAGVRPDGTFGSTVDAPAGYHPRNLVFDIDTFTEVPDNKLGFRADRDKDGWGVGTDDGDFFMPGSPFEAWGIQVGAGTTAINSSGGGAIAGTNGSATVTDGTASAV